MTPMFVPLLAAAWIAVVGCDPKLTGTDGGGDGGGDDDGPTEVSTEARAAGQLAAFHMDLIREALAHAASYDVPPPPAPRSVFPTTCITTVALTDTTFEMSLDTCVDTNGTEYQGKVGLEPPIDDTDGYIVFPYGDINRILATNETLPHYSHSYEQGTLTCEFTRDTGGDVNGVNISNFLRHTMLTTIASFSYVDFDFTGSPGNFSEWPDSDGSIQVSWDEVGVFTIEMSGTSIATFRVAGVDYTVDLSTGVVQIAQT
jgi:hypothetical protein